MLGGNYDSHEESLAAKELRKKWVIWAMISGILLGLGGIAISVPATSINGYAIGIPAATIYRLNHDPG